MINLKDTEVWSDFRKASKASEEDRDKMVEEIIEFALMHYSDKKKRNNVQHISFKWG